MICQRTKQRPLRIIPWWPYFHISPLYEKYSTLKSTNIVNKRLKRGAYMATQIVSFLNMKGGVGKSTLCYNIAYTIANHFQKNVLVIDMDPQFNTTQALIEKYSDTDAYLKLVDEQKTVKQIFVKNNSLVNRNVEPEQSFENIILPLQSNLSLICGDLDLITIESSQRGTENLLDSTIKKINEKFDYEYILIDCPPTHSFYTTSSLIASDYYFAPVKPDMYSLIGVELLQGVVKNVNELNRTTTKCLGIIFTMIRRGITTQERIITEVKSRYSGVRVFDNVMHHYQYNETGRLDTFMYDMISTKDEIIAITGEFLKELSYLE